MTALAAVVVGVVLAVPAYTAPVVDEARQVPDDVERSVGAALADYERRTGNEVAVAVVRTTGRQSIEDYANDLAERWKPGSGGRDNGVVVVVALEDRRVRIEVGDELQDELTDLESGRIVRERLVPLLREGDVGGAVSQGTVAIRQALDDPQAGSLPPPPEAEEPDGSPGVQSFWPLLFFGLAAVAVMGRRGRRGWSGGMPVLWGGGFGGGGGGGGGWSGGGGGGGFSGGGASGSW